MKSFLQILFSITNEDKHKVFRLLGIKFKFKRKIKPEGYIIGGENNKFIIVEEDGTERLIGKYEKIEGLNVDWQGSNCVVKIYKPTNFINCLLLMQGNNSYCEIGSTKYFYKNNGRFLVFGSNCSLIVGKNISCGEESILGILDTDNTSIRVGDDCMFSKNIQIRAGDGHVIYDLDTKEIVNNGKDTIVGNHVWLGADSIVLKGCKIADDCVIGAKSVVSKSILEPNTISVGVPSRIVKRNINWRREGAFALTSEK